MLPELNVFEVEEIFHAIENEVAEEQKFHDEGYESCESSEEELNFEHLPEIVKENYHLLNDDDKRLPVGLQQILVEALLYLEQEPINRVNLPEIVKTNYHLLNEEDKRMPVVLQQLLIEALLYLEDQQIYF